MRSAHSLVIPPVITSATRISPFWSSNGPDVCCYESTIIARAYAWIVAAVTFTVLLITAGVRATPGLLMVPLESEFGWSRAVVSGAVAINIALFGLIGPFAASVMDRWGLRRVMLSAIALLAISVALTTRMHTRWEVMLLWGVL